MVREMMINVTRKRSARPRRRAPAGREGGFALVVALLSLVGLTALATVGFLMSDTDYDVSQNHRASVRAFYAADAALKEYIGTQKGFPDDTMFFSYPDATARVTATLLNEPDSLQQIFLIESEGVYTPPEGGTAVRRMSTITIIDMNTLNAPAALTSPVGILKNGGAGTIDGYDESVTGDCPVAGLGDKPGVAVPPAGYQQNGGSTVPDGNPPIFEDAPLSILASTGIDWQAVVAGQSMLPDYVIPGDAWPNFNQLASDDWPVIYVDQVAEFEVNPPESGRGTIIVRHDFRMTGSFDWDGILLVGGRIVSDGNQDIRGAAVAGLNLLLGENPNTVDLGNGTKVFQYNSCNVYNAMTNLASMAEEPGTWFESM